MSLSQDKIPMPPRHWFMRIGLPLTLLVAVATLLVVSAWSSIVPARAVPTATALMREVETEVTATPDDDDSTVILAPGWVEPEPFGTYVATLAPGVVEAILVLEGDVITEGQPVAQLVTDEAQLALKTADAKVNAAGAALTSAIASAQSLPPQIRAAEAALHAIEDEHRRKATLVESGAVAAGPVERLRLRVEGAQADLERLQAMQAVAQAAVDSARAAIDTAVIQRDLAALTLERMTVRSPMDGIVMELMAAPGSVLGFNHENHGSHVLHMYDPMRLQVRADVPLADAAGVGAGQQAHISVDLLPDTVFNGEVLRFVHRADLQKNTVEAKVRINAPSPLLKPDMLARVRILPPKVDGEISRQRVGRVLVPAEAIANDTVWIVSGDGDSGLIESRSVQSGSGSWDGWVEIVDGVRPGDQVILDRDGLSPGDRVRGVERSPQGDAS
ncbi:MAG: efflux RND transporter periplasmic adaptor subunit [Phycisphaerales bacterium]|nr:efflux RND transporter periplasmic adaptor subunit [Phycisphaerales bacterium]